MRSIRRNQQVSNRNTLLRLHRLFIAITFALTPAILDGQEVGIGSDTNKPIEERIIYNRENTMHVTLHTQGLGAGFSTGKIRSIYNTTYWDFDASYIRSLKQQKLSSGYLFSSSSFIYGKLNDLLVLRAGYSAERRIYGKPRWGGVEPRWMYGIGASLGLLKPYYYVVAVASNTSGQYEEVLEYQTFEDSNNWIDIIGKAPFKYGLDEIKFRPGVYIKGGMDLEIGASKARAQSIAVGGMVEYFPQGVRLMANNPTDYVFLTLFLSYHWGSRFNKY